MKSSATEKEPDRQSDPYWMQRMGGRARAKKLGKKKARALSVKGGKIGAARRWGKKKKAKKK
jgi:hypothetical protein